MMKSSKALARKILCGLLAAGVVGVSGSALAAGYVTPVGGEKITSDVSYSGTGQWAIDNSIDGTADFSGSKIDVENNYKNGSVWTAGVLANVGTPTTKSIINLGNKDKTESVSIGVNGYYTIGIWAFGEASQGVPKGNGGEININTQELSVTGKAIGNDGVIYGICAQNGTVNTAYDKATININADKTYVNVSAENPVNAAGLVAMSQGILKVNSDLEVNATNAILTRGDSVIDINSDGSHSTKLYGNVTFDYDGPTSGTKVDSDVKINLSGTDSVWEGNTKLAWKVQNGQSAPDGDKLKVDSMVLSINDGATWTPTTVDNIIEDTGDGKVSSQYISLNQLKINDGVINLDKEKLASDFTVKVDVVNGKGIVATNSLDNSMSITSLDGDANITVQGTGDIADAIQRDASNAQKLADVVSTGEGEAKKSVASEVKTAEGKVGGAYYAKVDKSGNIETASEVHTENTTNRAITDMASISIMTWRQENNDMNKRLGELRDSKGEHGAWARMARGESKYGSQNVKNQYNYYQVGYDEKLSTNPNWTVGVALTRTEGTSTFTNGSGENKHTGFAVYGSYLADNGSFIDLIAKYARMDNDYKTVTGAGSGDYETNGYSLSAEYGKRFTKDNGFWIEPQVELTYGKVSSVDYLTANKVQVSQGDTNSLVGRLGFSLGKDIKQGNVYVRASYLYDFDGETDVKMVDTVSGTPASYKQDLGGGWWEVGVGTNLNLSDATHLYFDVEKTFGGNVATPWQWNAGVRWSF